MPGRLLGVLALLGALLAFAAEPALARPPAGPGTTFPETLDSTRFQFHYTGLVTSADRVLQSQVGDLATNMERAYALFIDSWGYPAPKADADGKVDVWIRKQPANAPLALAWFETAPPSTVWLDIDPSKVTDATFAASLVMFTLQGNIWYPSDSWLQTASAQWAGFAANGYEGAGDMLPLPDISLDCTGDSCGTVVSDILGNSRWTFFQFLSERYGTSILKDVLTVGKQLNDPTRTGRDLLVSALAAKGTTLSAAFNDYAAVHVAGAYTPATIKGKAPPVHATFNLGLVSDSYAARKIGVNHLATRFVRFQRDPTNKGQCHSATLSVTVALPKDAGSRPALYAKSLGATALPLTVSGSTATISVPWSTCPGDGDAYLALPNPSLTANGQEFVVSASLAVTSASLTPPSTPPPPIYAGPVVAAPTAEITPSILLHGPEQVRVPASTRAARLLVFSSGDGVLTVTVDKVVVGTFTLRPGNNDVRFVLPAGALASERGEAAAGTPGALVLTAGPKTGTAAAESLTRSLVLFESKKTSPTSAKAKKAKRTGR